MKEYRLTDWLPTTKKEVELRGWDELDVILFSGDAYVDHPSFGAAVIGRILEAEGLRVAIIPQPNWRDDPGCTSGYASGVPFHCIYPDIKEAIPRCPRRTGRHRGKHAPPDAL